MYTTLATAKTPFLVIYLIDVSASMAQEYDGLSRIEAVSRALQKIMTRMVMRSTKGTMVSARYRVAMFAYSSQVIDLLGGIQTIDVIAKIGVPRLTTLDATNTAAAFLEAENLLKLELPKMESHPAPMICHLTDGQYNSGGNPQAIVKRIMNMGVPDGKVLVENIFVGDILMEPVYDVYHWNGVTSETPFSNPYGKLLAEMSSPFPESYRNLMQEVGYRIGSNTLMMIPAHNPELLELAFTVSGATPITAS